SSRFLQQQIQFNSIQMDTNVSI
ncbi:unnamed protein product, partial [Rotaria magnacalcarata]